MKRLPALILGGIAFAAFGGQANAQEPDLASELAVICVKERCHPPGSVRVVLEDGTTKEVHSQYPFPIVQGGMVAIFPGDTIYLGGESVDGRLVDLRAVDEPATPVNVLKLRMYQRDGKPDTYLELTNHFPRVIKYRAGMMLPDGEDIYDTSSCPVIGSGGFVLEHWPYPIFQLLLMDFQAVASDGELVCE